ncbi:MAG: protein kinase domain-containing protein [Pyrinomonadaceae bacterium]
MNNDLKAGTNLLHYRIVSKIGAGGMGEVYLAEDIRLDRKVAIKFLNEEYRQDADKLNRFVQEARAASALNHPNILTVYEIGEIDGKNYIATEWIDGMTLREHLKGKQTLDLKQIFKIALQVSEALSAAHQAGIIHRDIKPENIMIRKDGYAKVLDFGLAKLSEQAADENAKVKTTPGLIMGTVLYMSPEQARGKATDARTDVWSLGVVLYEMLAGKVPFDGETINHTIVAILEKEPAPLRQIHPELEKIALRALAKNINKRYRSTAELIEDLRSLQKRLEFEEELERTSSPDGSGDNPTQIFKADNSSRIETGNTIAVMPFVNMSRNEDGDYFSDGLAEELLNVLSKIRGLRVAARTSAFSFKGKQATIAEIGYALNVASLLEGSIRMSGNRVRISVQLIKVEDGYQLWSETYDRTMDDIFAVQDDIAQSVVEELRTRLLAEDPGSNISSQVVSEVADAVKGRAASPEAQRLMLLGRYFIDKLTREDTAKGIEYFRKSLELDPGYALCWAELGRAYTIEAGRAWIPVGQGIGLAREAANRALELEPELAEGHTLLGRIQISYDLDVPGGEASHVRALELAPGSSTVLDGASVMAYKMGRLDEALELGRRVLVQDPLSPAYWHNLGLTAHSAGQLTESEKAFRRALELVPQRFVSGALLALVLMDQGRADEALAQAKQEPDEFWRLWALAMIYHVLGRVSDSDDALDTLNREHADGNAYQLAEIHAVRGEKDQALDWLERAVDERDAGVTHAKVNPRFRNLREDPRWNPLLGKIGFKI